MRDHWLSSHENTDSGDNIVYYRHLNLIRGKGKVYQHV